MGAGEPSTPSFLFHFRYFPLRLRANGNDRFRILPTLDSVRRSPFPPSSTHCTRARAFAAHSCPNAQLAATPSQRMSLIAMLEGCKDVAFNERERLAAQAAEDVAEFEEFGADLVRAH